MAYVPKWVDRTKLFELIFEKIYETEEEITDSLLEQGEDVIVSYINAAGVYEEIFVDLSIPIDDTSLKLAAFWSVVCEAINMGKMTWKTGEVTSERLGEVSRSFAPTQLSRFLLGGESQHKSPCGLKDFFFEKFLKSYGVTTFPQPQVSRDEDMKDLEELVEKYGTRYGPYR